MKCILQIQQTSVGNDERDSDFIPQLGCMFGVKFCCLLCSEILEYTLLWYFPLSYNIQSDSRSGSCKSRISFFLSKVKVLGEKCWQLFCMLVFVF